MSRAKSLVLCLWNDQTGFILTAELVLIATILVLGLIVGLTAVQSAVVGELNDVGAAIGSLNQSYSYNGFASRKYSRSFGDCGTKAFTAGSAYHDVRDECDADFGGQALSCMSTDPTPEAAAPKKDKDRDDDDDDKRSEKDDDKPSDKKDKKDKEDDDD
jgi:hypothetical protein